MRINTSVLMRKIYRVISDILSDEMYCICYDDGKTKKLLINQGLFRSYETCLDYIDKNLSIIEGKFSVQSIKVTEKTLSYSAFTELDEIENTLFDIEYKINT